MSDWNPWQAIDSAPKDGVWFIGRRGHLERRTQWGKTSHVPMYGWCYVASQHDSDPDYDLWQPVEWRRELSEEIIRAQRAEWPDHQ